MVWKYPLSMIRVQELELPANAHILTVQVQRETPCIWALVDETMPLERRRIMIFGTGQPDEDLGKLINYIGTFQMLDGDFVWHVFESVLDARLANAEAFVEHEEKPVAALEELLVYGV